MKDILNSIDMERAVADAIYEYEVENDCTEDEAVDMLVNEILENEL